MSAPATTTTTACQVFPVRPNPATSTSPPTLPYSLNELTSHLIIPLQLTGCNTTNAPPRPQPGNLALARPHLDHHQPQHASRHRLFLSPPRRPRHRHSFHGLVLVLVLAYPSSFRPTDAPRRPRQMARRHRLRRGSQRRGRRVCLSQSPSRRHGSRRGTGGP